MIKAERLKQIQKLKDLVGNEVYQVRFKSGERFHIPVQGVGLVSFLDEVAPKLDQVKAYLIVDTETHQILAACLNQGGSWINLAFTKEMTGRQARELPACLERLQQPQRED